MEKHKCIECGYLAAKNLKTRKLDEVEKEFRKSGIPPNEISGGKEIWYPVHKNYPVCFIQRYDLPHIFDTLSGSESDRFLSIINENRPCEHFATWYQGFSPKEHREMMDRKAMLEWQAEREDADRKWRESQEKRHSREEWNRHIFLAVIAIVAVILGVILGCFIK